MLFVEAVRLLAETRTVGPARVARVTQFQAAGRRAPWYRVELEDGQTLVMSSRVMRQPPRVGYSYQFDVTADPRKGQEVYRVRRIRTVAVDIVLFRPSREEGNVWPEVLLIRRGGAPYRGRWALPGGMVDPGEPPAQAARRELEEETGIQVERLTKIGVFEAPGRDPRQRHVQSHAYSAFGDFPDAQAGDDATAAEWVPIQQAQSARLAFDHQEIIARAQSVMGDEIAGTQEYGAEEPEADVMGEVMAHLAGYVPVTPGGDFAAPAAGDTRGHPEILQAMKAAQTPPTHFEDHFTPIAAAAAGVSPEEFDWRNDYGHSAHLLSAAVGLPVLDSGGSEEEVARAVHVGWMANYLRWLDRMPPDEALRRLKHMVPYDDLPNDVKEYDRENVRAYQAYSRGEQQAGTQGSQG